MTSAKQIVQLVLAFDAHLWVLNDDLELDAPLDFPDGLVHLLRQHKAEVLHYLSEHAMCAVNHYRFKYQSSSHVSDRELEDILQSVRQHGFVLAWSPELNDLVAFHRSDLDLQLIPPGFVPYSTREMAVLFGPDENLPIESLRLIHQAKKYGARIVDDLNGGVA